MHNLKKNLGKLFVYNEENEKVGFLDYEIIKSVIFIP